MAAGKRVIQTMGLLLLSVMLLTGRGGYGQTQPNTLFSPPISINAFGSCPDASGDAFAKSNGRPVMVPASLDLRRAQLRRERDDFGTELLKVEFQVFGPLPPTLNDAGDVYFMVIDLDRQKNTGDSDGIFGLGKDLAVSVVYSRDRLVQSQFLLWPAAGGDDPAVFDVTPRIDPERHILSVQIPVSILDAQYSALRGSPIPLDDPEWGAYTEKEASLKTDPQTA
ncbi:hypothetical protein HYR54_05060 [Candidatus Acetothermia bacterium]|nr:hypothetical protein [Candidatus Acetothermia bacterium]